MRIDAAHPVEHWTEPVIRWRRSIDRRLCRQRLTDEGELLATWPPAPFEDAPTECFRVGGGYWIWQPGIGGLHFLPDRPECVAFTAEHADPVWFRRVVTRSWLPAVYQVWGRQVLHASAATRGGDVIAFAGSSGVGKSTLAYGLGQRSAWRQVCDDTLAFSCQRRAGERAIALHPLANDVRLRPASAAYFGRAAEGPEPLSWPPAPLNLRRLYFLSGDERLRESFIITPVKLTAGYPLLLEQAHAFTLKIPEYNQRLMRDYLDLATTIPAFLLAYRRSFEAIDETLDAIERHLHVAVEPGEPAESSCAAGVARA